MLRPQLSQAVILANRCCGSHISDACSLMVWLQWFLQVKGQMKKGSDT